MFTSHSRHIAALTAFFALAASAIAAPVDKPVAGQQVHFPNGYWSGLPQAGPDGKVRQCVMVALRQRTGRNGPVDTRFSINISRGTGLAIMIQDDGLPSEQVLDDQAELTIEDRAFPAVYFPIGNAQIFHPGDADGALTALGKATQVRLRSDGGSIDSGAIKIELAADALSWLKQCGKTFDIAIDKVSVAPAETATLERLAHLRRPWCIAFTPDGDRLITEKHDGVRVMRGDVLLPGVLAGGPPNVLMKEDSGLLDILSVPDCDVDVDGKSAGKTPITAYKVKAGSHDVTFHDEVTGDRTFTVIVQPGEAKTVKTDRPPRATDDPVDDKKKKPKAEE